MALPDPLPDDPRKWEGWKFYNSPNPYERLCMDPLENPGPQLIEENCRRLLVWWQKKLPLKNQPSNPLSQLLRGGLDEAPMFLSEARSLLLDPVCRRTVDEGLMASARERAIAELTKLLDFAISQGTLSPEDESRLHEYGVTLGLEEPLVTDLLARRVAETGARRLEAVSRAPAAGHPRVTPNIGPPPDQPQPAEEFLRMLRLTNLSADDMTDDQRDAFVTMAENLGIPPGDAEDLVDIFLDEMEQKQLRALPKRPATTRTPSPPILATTQKVGTRRLSPRMTPQEARQTPQHPQRPIPNPSQERARYQNFQVKIGQEMLLVPSGLFAMGSTRPGCAPNESPVIRVHLQRFYISRHPITNSQFERHDPTHRRRRLPTAGDDHPVVHVSYAEAVKFCQWISATERRRCRLPTEAEWEYAAKGTADLSYPWGERVSTGNLANFADLRTNFPWSDRQIDDGFAETSPVGHYPLGASPFGVEDLAGNVWEWCHDYLDTYKGGERYDPTGPSQGSRRVVRGGSWRSRFSSLRTTCRNGHPPTLACNDIGFRIVIECD